MSTTLLLALALRLVPPSAIGEDFRGEWRVVVTNDGGAAEPVVLTARAPLDPVVAMPAEICAPDASAPQWAVCTFTLAAHESRELAFTVQYRSRTGYFGFGALTDTVAESDQVIFGREYAVTSSADDGPGSLRAALLDVNRECVTFPDPCVVVFRLDEPTIRPGTALPEIVAPHVYLDGRALPRVVLDGSAVPEGHGLLIRSLGAARVEGLTIANFPGNGIEATGGLALDVRHNELRSNGLRGLQVTDASTVSVSDNVLAFNQRAGAFFWTKGSVGVRRNHVIGNGASGLFFHKPAGFPVWDSATAVDNVIEHNAHAGIGLSLAAQGNFAGNTFRHNASLPIDVGLDGDTREPWAGVPGHGGRIGAPSITSARFDGTATIVEGRIAPRNGSIVFDEVVTIYAGTTPAEAEVVARVETVNGPTTFTARIERDLRGLTLRAATSARYLLNFDDPAPGTSELSAPVPVE